MSLRTKTHGRSCTHKTAHFCYPKVKNQRQLRGRTCVYKTTVVHSVPKTPDKVLATMPTDKEKKPKASPFSDFFGGLLGKAVEVKEKQDRLKAAEDIGKKRPAITKPPSKENK